jgi:hypothetical protein
MAERNEDYWVTTEGLEVKKAKEEPKSRDEEDEG